MLLSHASLEFIRKQDEALRKDIAQSKYRVLIALFSSSFLLFFGISTVATLTLQVGPGNFLFEGSRFIRPYVSLPILANVTAWFLWGAYSYTQVIKAIMLPKDPDIKGELDEPGVRYLLDQYQLTQTSYKRQQKAETMIIFLVAMQLSIMGFSVFYLLFTLR